jgi:hypothetical protein
VPLAVADARPIRQRPASAHPGIPFRNAGRAKDHGDSQRTGELIQRGYARRTDDGVLRVKANLIGTLTQREVERVGRELAAERGLTFNAIADGEHVQGKLLGSTQLASGRFAMIDDGLNFSLVPWRPVIEREIGREVFGVMRGNDISWQLGRARGLGIGM